MKRGGAGIEPANKARNDGTQDGSDDVCGMHALLIGTVLMNDSLFKYLLFVI